MDGDMNTLRSYAPNVLGDIVYDMFMDHQHTKRDYKLRDRAAAREEENPLIPDWNRMMRYNENVGVPRADVDKFMKHFEELYTSFTKFLAAVYQHDGRLQNYLLDSLNEAKDALESIDYDSEIFDIRERRQKSLIKGILKGAKSFDPRWGEQLEERFRDDVE